MNIIQTKSVYSVLLLAFLLLTFPTYSISATSQETSNINSCKKIYLSTNTNANISLTTKEHSEASLLAATDKNFHHQGSTCFSLINPSASEKKISIYLENARVRHVELLNITHSIPSLIGINGMEYPLKNWQQLGAELFFDLTVPANTTETFKLSIGSVFSYNSLVKIHDTSKKLHLILVQQSIAGVLAGFIGALVLYSAFLGFISKEKTYLFLFGSTACVTLLQLNDMGLLYLVWPESLYWNNVCSGLFAITSTIYGIALARSYLLTKNNTPKIEKILVILFWYTIAALPLPLLQNDTLYYLLYALPTVSITLPCLVVACVARMRQGYSPAKLYLFALSAPVIAGLIIFLMYAGVLPSSQITRILPLVGTAIQILLLGYAIGERIRWIKNQKNASIATTLQARAESSAKKNFLTHVSHELRTPLAGIIGLTEIARKNPIYTDNKQLIEGIHDSAEVLLSSVNMLLDHARLDAGKWKTNHSIFSLQQLIDDTLAAHAQLAEKKSIRINTQIAQNTPTMIDGEKNIIQKIVDCILDFSIGNMSHGHILVKVEPEKFNEQYAIRLDIIDTGDGISEEQRATIFEIFEQQDKSTTREQRGIGINLSLASKLCHFLGGDMGCESNPLHGTAFWCHIPCRPLKDNPLSTESHTKLTPTEFSASRDTILVAEDDETLQMIIASQLEQLGKKFRVFPNGKPLVDDYIKNHHQIAAIFLDWNMPICNASAATLLIRNFEKEQNLTPIPTVILTAHDKASTNELGLPAGLHVLHKPITIDDLSQLFTTLKQ